MGTNAFPLSPEPVSEGDNSLIRYLRSMTNYLGGQGQQTYAQGQQTFAQGVQDFGPALQYFQQILSGNKAEMESAIAPEKQSILDKYRAARKSMAATGPRSGGTNEAVAQSEFSEAGDVASLMQKLRPEAAKQTGTMADMLAKLGLGQTRMGMDQLAQAIEGLLTVRGQDVGVDMSNMRNLTSGLETVFAALI